MNADYDIVVIGGTINGAGIARQPIDLRAGFDGVASRVQEINGADPSVAILSSSWADAVII